MKKVVMTTLLGAALGLTIPLWLPLATCWAIGWVARGVFVDLKEHWDA